MDKHAAKISVTEDHTKVVLEFTINGDVGARVYISRDAAKELAEEILTRVPQMRSEDDPLIKRIAAPA